MHVELLYSTWRRIKQYSNDLGFFPSMWRSCAWKIWLQGLQICQLVFTIWCDINYLSVSLFSLAVSSVQDLNVSLGDHDSYVIYNPLFENAFSFGICSCVKFLKLCFRNEIFLCSSHWLILYQRDIMRLIQWSWSSVVHCARWTIQDSSSSLVPVFVLESTTKTMIDNFSNSSRWI